MFQKELPIVKWLANSFFMATGSIKNNKEYQHSQHTSEKDLAVLILIRKFEEAKLRNPMLSLRGFSQKIGISSGAFSELIKGRRPLTLSIKNRIAPKLFLSPQESIEFFKSHLPSNMGIDIDDRLVLSQDHFHLISEWWYFGLLNLIKTKGFKNQVQWMALRLGVGVHIINEAWGRLKRLGYIEENENKVIRKHPHLKTTDNLVDLSIRQSHLKDLSLIEKSLAEVDLHHRDNTSCTFVIDKKDIPKAKEMLRIFQAQFLKEIGKECGEEVYKFSMALYPLTQLKEFKRTKRDTMYDK